MNRLKLLKIHIIFSGLAVLLASCDKEQPLNLEGSDCSIVSFSIISDNASPVEAKIYPDRITAVFDYNFDFSEAAVEFSLSEGATISPDPNTIDLSKDNTFIVTSASGESSQEYSYSVQFDSMESYCKKNIYLQSQSEVDEFGKNNYTRVFSIVINGTEENPITDLSPLGSLLFIDHNFTVKGFQGQEIKMDNLQKVSSIDIVADTLETISFGNITETDNIMIGFLNEGQTTPSAVRISAIDFNKLEIINNNFVLYLNTTEEYDDTGFNSLREINGEAIMSLYNETNLKFLSNLTQVNHISISGGKITSLEGLDNLKTINGTFSLQYLSQLTEIEMLRPKTIRNISITSCTKLTNLNCLNLISELETISITGAQSLTDISGLSGIKRINNGLYFRYSGLTNLDALSGLEYVGNTILFNYNSALEDFTGLKQCLENFDGTYDVKGNKSNPSIDDIIG